MEYLSTFAKSISSENLFSVTFTREELCKCGVQKDSVDFDEQYYGKHELHKLSLLWSDPYYLADFYEKNEQYFEVEYWKGITPEKFAEDVIYHSPKIFDELRRKAISNQLDESFEALDPKIDGKQTGEKISRAKAKFGQISSNRAFRIYAIKIDSNCFLITGGAIKITLEMDGAEHTKNELNKINFVYNKAQSEHIFDKLSFFDLIFE